MDLRLTSLSYGSISVFDFISVFIFIVRIKSFLYYSKSVYFFLIIFLSFFLFVGCIKSEFIVNSLFNFLKFFSILIYSRLLINECLNDKSFLNIVLKYLKLGCIFSLIFLLIQLFLGLKFTFYPYDLSSQLIIGTNLLRYPSYFQDPQKYGQYLSMLAFLFLLQKESKYSSRILNYCFFIIIILAIFLSGTRSAFWGFFVGSIILFFSIRSKIKYIVPMICLMGYFIITNFSEFFSIFNRTDDFNSSILTRYQFWKEGFDIFFAHPIFGVGIGNHQDFVMNHFYSDFFLENNDKVSYFGTESGYLQTLIEFGIFGFIFTLIIIFTPIINAIRCYNRNHNINLIILLASITSWMIAWSTVNSLLDKRILIIVGTLLCLLIVSNIHYKSLNA
jgi:O-antigen ligase